MEIRKEIKVITILFIVIFGILYIWNETQNEKKHESTAERSSTIHAKLYKALSAVKDLEKNHKNDDDFEDVHWNKVKILKNTYESYLYLYAEITLDSALKNEISAYYEDPIERLNMKNLVEDFQRATGVNATVVSDGEYCFGCSDSK